ncbi:MULTISPECIES: carbamoyl-phosphate synthase large subunit [unclassified Campylobacter]|uniref:carbamoyl-phosphate synthase large subunit n=1 Tax=unclassified Campylobacter TaxID=2593542 RepID=UPI001237E319|nr:MULTISPECIES: carbamoyl-phosphate synthase large subunit [unclassified Campylobacter]KAA6227141.1 carbamoyl-phosphate synthase large subunit [Campylobacter sp. LR185c]KAA6227462.1 carbamoyl-phosphate synthase large subunit [Campylobacter sp. LR196d]KAA6228489.1 carbamoyl-phosphate synthase large subunit [Campylobacter sp. LR286c]KAA6230879.1 carbamoyl-phosphate synthase large subunit [Campylobacter sp. LR291e]KAA6233514.1 carbamoyl-phosphate synthase large subunit [Campylobacter sp. LR264d]
MPKRTDINTILLIGSGPIVIGQACEFDYSGTQAAKTLKELGYRVVLINSNPATIMTDPEFADATYIEPITKESILSIIEKEKVDAILPTMGGQVALNVAMEVFESNLLKDVTFLGAKPDAIKKGEDRQIFKECMQKIGMDLPKSMYAYNYDEALRATNEIGFPLMIRASYTLGGAGSGVVYNMDEFKELATSALNLSPIHEILIEESLLGWKEYEMEVIRDRLDNCIIVCSIENVDPMGVHTGDSITIAPALTLTDKEYQAMRDASFAILREIGVDTGGSNVQFAINPKNGRMIVIEMNPRVSRSSALASKATGYPIAKVATLLAVGFSLDEIKNDITGTPASFEPVIDYIVTKIPRFTFEKFPGAITTLGTAMKSVGEIMAIGRTFKESIQKALCSLERNLSGFDRIAYEDSNELIYNIRNPNEKRLLYIAQAFRENFSVDELYEFCKIDKWFLEQIKEIVDFEKNIDMDILHNKELLRQAKTFGFSDKMIAYEINLKDNLDLCQNDIYYARKNLNIICEFNEVDTCAGEFKALTPYLYSSMNVSELTPINKKSENNEKKVMIIGGGPNRIGQGIEFDYACVHASFALKDMGVKTIMYNCNPETVSTDYDTSDILYFEPIDFEHLRAVIEHEKPDGIIVHFGGQTPLKFAKRLSAFGAKIIGTSARVIDLAEDRKKFSEFITRLKISQPKNSTATNIEEALIKANQIKYPVLVRPSYVLGGRAMRVVNDENELKLYMQEAVQVSDKSPVLIDEFLENASEIDVDAISDGKNVYVAGIMEHIEEAGIHSGDSACSLPPCDIDEKMQELITQKTADIALNLGVVGLLNIQFAIYNNELFMIEVNPRASRTVPFVSKATGIPLAKVATRVMWQGNLEEALKFYDKFGVVDYSKNILRPKKSKHISVKEAVFPFAKLSGSDLELGPEMRSTGEVMGISKDFATSFAKSQISSFNHLPKKGTIFISLKQKDKNYAKKIAQEYSKLGFKLMATSGTCKEIIKNGFECELVYKISEGRPNVEDKLKNGEIDLVINTSDQYSFKDDTKKIRENIIRFKIPYFTNLSSAFAGVKSISTMQNKTYLEVKSLQEYLKND